MSNLSFSSTDQLEFFFCQIDGVTKDRLRSQKSMVVIDVGVRSRVWKHGFDECDLVRVFSYVCLDWQVGLLLNAGQAVHQLGGAAGCETWGEDGSDERVGRVDTGDVVYGCTRVC